MTEPEGENTRASIRGLSFMFALADDVQERVVAAFEETSRPEAVGKGTILLTEGDETTNHGYIVLAGKVSVERSDGAGFKTRPPVLLGEMKQFDPEHQRTASARAEDDLRVLRFEWDTFYDALGSRLSEAEIAEFRGALHEYARMHFLANDL